MKSLPIYQVGIIVVGVIAMMFAFQLRKATEKIDSDKAAYETTISLLARQRDSLLTLSDLHLRHANYWRDSLQRYNSSQQLENNNITYHERRNRWSNLSKSGQLRELARELDRSEYPDWRQH